ncbi:MAG: CvpA family protein [Alistipes sp.]|jgi:membrane protein required for colicin V production|nr:CvpA family protein [Alistipes sp.]
MNWLDIVIGLLLLVALWDGWRNGVVTQVLGLLAVGLGIFLAWRYGAGIGLWFGLDGVAATVVGFLAVLVVVVVGVVLIGRLTRGLFRVAGLGVFDNLLGVVFAVVKMFALVGLAVMLLEAVDIEGRVLSERVKEGSAMYGVVDAVNGVVFPAVKSLF